MVGELTNQQEYYTRNWEDLYQSLWKARRWWGIVAMVLTRKGAMVRMWSMLYKVVVQTVLLYGSEIWVATESMLKVLEGFHHRVARWIVGNTDRRTVDGEWEYPPVADAL